MSLTVKCPSGLSVTLREFKVSDEDLLADPKSQRKGVAVTELLTAITEGVDDVGLYKLRDRNKKHDEPWLDWATVLQGDRMTILLKNRIYTWGSELTFSQPCPNCQQNVDTDIDLEEMPIKALPESSKPHVINPQEAPLFCTLPRCGVRVGFRLLLGSDDRAMEKIQKDKKATLSSAYLRYRITKIEGVNQPDWNPWIRNLGGADAAFLRAAFDEPDCGVDQEVQFSCDSCNQVWTDDVRFRSDFLFPKYRGKTQTKT